MDESMEVGGGEPVRSLESCEQLLSREFSLFRPFYSFAVDDFILDPAVSQVLANYREAGGSDEKAKELLSEGYRGSCPLANLLGRWLSMLESDDLPSTSKKVQLPDLKAME